MCIPHALGAGMAYFTALPAMRMSHQNTQYLIIHHQTLCTVFAWFLHLLFCQLLVGTWKEIFYFATNIINDCWIIFMIWILNAGCVYIALLRLACFWNFVCTLPHTFCLSVDLLIFLFLYLLCCSWLIGHLEFLCLACLGKVWLFPGFIEKSYALFLIVLNYHFTYA